MSQQQLPGGARSRIAVGSPLVGLALGLALLPAQLAAQEVHSGDILGAFIGDVVVVDPATGARSVLSEDPTGSSYLSDIRIDSKGRIVALQYLPNAVYYVDWATGTRELVTDLNNPSQGPIVGVNTFLTMQTLHDATVLIAENTGDHRILRVDPETGMRTVLSDFDDPGLGPTGSPAGMIQEPNGAILVGVYESLERPDLIFRVDLTTGARTLVSDSIGGEAFNGLALDADGDLLAISSTSFTCQGAIHRIDLSSGQRTLLSEPPFSLTAIAIAGDGSILYTAIRSGFCQGGPYRLYRLAPSGGIPRLLSENVAYGIAVVPGIFRSGFEDGDIEAWSESRP